MFSGASDYSRKESSMATSTSTGMRNGLSKRLNFIISAKRSVTDGSITRMSISLNSPAPPRAWELNRMILLGFEELVPFDASYVPLHAVRHPVHPNEVPVA